MIYTVNGPIKKGELGVTLSHEHLAWDSSDVERLYFEKKYDEEKVEHWYNQLLPVFNKLYKLGCRTIFEASPPRGGQNLRLMQKLSQASGIKLIANTGLALTKYVHEIHKEAYEKELAQRWVDDFEKGLDTINRIVIRPSHIKIFLSNGKLPTVEKKILKAAVMASKATDLPIHCHIIEAKIANEAIDLLEKESFDFSKFLWAHAGYEANFEVLEKAIFKGMWLGFDMIKWGNHEKYCSLIKEAIKRGYKDRIILSQDYDFYEEVLRSRDHHPCASIFTDFIPYCEENGLSQEVIKQFLTENPANFFDIAG